MKVLAVTSTRADWGLLVPVLDALRDDPGFDLQIAATGQHNVAGQHTLQWIAADGHQADYIVDMMLGDDDSPKSLADNIGILFSGFGRVLAEAAPDILLLLGDRYETLAVAQAAVLARLPIAHMCGGDVTEGAMDDSIRHAITKLSAIHFPTNMVSATRILQMGEHPLQVHAVGSTGVDRLLAVEKLERKAFFDSVGLTPRDRNFIVTFHPPTLSANAVEQARWMLDALDGFADAGMIFTGSNADTGGREIDRLVQAHVAQRGNAVFHASLGTQNYVSALVHCDLVIGNSSSGIMEAPSLQIPTINIGDRQARRPRASSVVDCEPQPAAIRDAIRSALSMRVGRVENPYGDGGAARRILAVLKQLNDPQSLTRKSFQDQQDASNP